METSIGINGNTNIKVVLDSEKSIDKIGNFTLVKNGNNVVSFEKQQDNSYTLSYTSPSYVQAWNGGVILDDYKNENGKYKYMIVICDWVGGSTHNYQYYGIGDTKSFISSWRLQDKADFKGAIIIPLQTNKYFQFGGYSQADGGTFRINITKIFLV